jgi:hypothetical protein
MTRAHKIEAWVALAVIVLLAAGTLAILRWGTRRPLSLRGAVLVQDTDPHKQLPIAGVVISAGDLAVSDATTDSSGLFVVNLRKPIRRGHFLVLHFRDPKYQPLDLKEFVGDQLYVVHLTPVPPVRTPDNQPVQKVSNIRVRYTVKVNTEVSVGSEVHTFEVENKGNVPCKKQAPCSPDGRWKAAVGKATMDAGVGNQFRSARASCIAGPCPFTRVETDHFSRGGQFMTVAARDWSDTATFLIEAEVFRPMSSPVEHWSYPAIFGEGMSFTLPASAESVSIEADLAGQTIIYPLGPSLFLSWATCERVNNPDQGRVYRCTPKAGYKFQ